MATREITGRHVLAGFVAAFSLIIGVNVALAVNAVRTFPGLEVKNSYEASQNFDREKAAQLALGWDVSAEIEEDELRLTILDRDGRPVVPAELHAILGKATHVKADREPDFRYVGGVHVAKVDIGPGNWNLRMRAVADDGTEFHQRIVLTVRS